VNLVTSSVKEPLGIPETAAGVAAITTVILTDMCKPYPNMHTFNHVSDSLKTPIHLLELHWHTMPAVLGF